jgi:hypothetical protein
MKRRFALAGLLALTACAADQVRLEHAGKVSDQAKAVAKAADLYVADVQARRREANIAFVALDPNCGWGPVVTVDIKWNGRRGLCDLRGVPKERRVPFSLRPVSAEALKAVTGAVAGVVAYQAALADVLDDKPVDAKKTLDDAISTLATASSDINRIAGQNLLDLSPLTGATAKAVTDLIGTLVEMQQTNLKVRRVRAVVLKTDSAALYVDLKSGIGRVSRLQDQNSSDTLFFGLDTAYRREGGRLSFDQRRERLRQIAAAYDDKTGLRDKRKEVLTEVVDELAKADISLRKALNGEFSREDQRRIARMNRAQAFGLLSKIAALFPAV